MKIEWHPYPQVKPKEYDNYLVAVTFDDGDLLIETDYWQGSWDDNEGIHCERIHVIGWAELPTLKNFEYLIGVRDGKHLDTL